ncbi:hypothetical protein D3C71_981010 [compost metagenome]
MIRQPDQEQPADDHRHAQYLPHGQPVPGQIAQLGVRYADELDDETEDAIEQREHPRYRHGRPRLAREQPQDQEQCHAFEGELVQLRRMTRQLRRIGRKDHRPRHIGCLAPQLGVDEVADTPGAQANRHHRRNEIHQLEERLVVLLAEPQCRQHHADETAVERHTALPHFEDQRRVGQIGAQIVEQHITQAPADNHPHRHPEHHVGEFFLGPGRVEAVQPAGGQQPGAADADQVHQTVPVDFQRTDGQGHRVDLRVRQHCDSSLEFKS